jgi:aspartate/glutamate racemase
MSSQRLVESGKALICMSALYSRLLQITSFTNAKKIADERVNAVFFDETRNRMLPIAGKLKEKNGIHALILGGTELPLILRDSGNTGIPFLDTTMIIYHR